MKRKQNKIVFVSDFSCKSSSRNYINNRNYINYSQQPDVKEEYFPIKDYYELNYEEEEMFERNHPTLYKFLKKYGEDI